MEKIYSEIWGKLRQQGQTRLADFRADMKRYRRKIVEARGVGGPGFQIEDNIGKTANKENRGSHFVMDYRDGKGGNGKQANVGGGVFSNRPEDFIIEDNLRWV